MADRYYPGDHDQRPLGGGHPHLAQQPNPESQVLLFTVWITGAAATVQGVEE